MNFSCIYSIQCKDKEVKEFYIGSTINYSVRRSTHKYRCNTLKKETTIYKYIRENGGWDNWEMIVEVKTNDLCIEERLELEQFYIDLLEPLLNRCNAKGDNIKKTKETRKQYEKTNNYKNFRKKYDKIRVNCCHCNLEMNKGSIYRHIKKQHT